MSSYWEPIEYGVRSLYFQYLGAWYDGRGALNWDPDRGFHLAASLNRLARPLPEEIAFGTSGVVQRANVRAIRMRLATGDWALAPAVQLVDRFDIVNEERLSIDLDRVLFLSRGAHPQASRPCGSAVYAWSGTFALPDQVTTETHVRGELFSRSQKRGGLRHEDDHIALVAIQEKEGRAEMSWTVKEPTAKRATSWRWSDGLQYALAVAGGCTVQTLLRSSSYSGRLVEEWQKCRPGTTLSLIAPLPHRPFLNRGRFLALARFFGSQGTAQQVSRAMFNQLAEAARQRTWAARELLLATILEAALRTLHEHAFAAKKSTSKVDVKKELDVFRRTYLSDDWIEVCRRAFLAHLRLRDRNAHPDWLISERGGLSEEELVRRLDDQIFLATFYGYMILALAGCADLRPEFPAPHRHWSAALTLRQGPSEDAPV